MIIKIIISIISIICRENGELDYFPMCIVFFFCFWRNMYMDLCTCTVSLFLWIHVSAIWM